jgi:ketosteroid isomerase-like protein
MSNRLQPLETALNEMTAKGQILDALSKHYADDCVFVEGDGSRLVNRKAQHDHLAGFLATLKGFNGATLHAQSMGDGVSMSEWTFDMTAADGSPIVWNEALVRRWKDDRVISERFYQAQSAR